MVQRIPERLFTPDLAAAAKSLLLRLSPPATRVVLQHLDAPGWVIVDLDGSVPRSVGPRVPADIPSDWWGRPLIASMPMRYDDSELALEATEEADHLSWQWRPAARCTVHGWFPKDKGWGELRRLVSGIAVQLRELLTLSPS
jgi:hypothetical protein